MRLAAAIMLLITLTGCKIQTEIRENAIHTELANKEGAVQVKEGAVQFKDGAVQVANKENAVHVERESIHVEKDAMHVEDGAIGHFEKDAVHVEPGALSIQGTVQPGAVHAPMTVQTGAIQMPLTTNVADGAVKLNLEFKIEPGAIVVRGVEQGAVQIETPWWAYVIMAVLGIGWMITKFRRHTSRSRGVEKSFWDIPF